MSISSQVFLAFVWSPEVFQTPLLATHSPSKRLHHGSLAKKSVYWVEGKRHTYLSVISSALTFKIDDDFDFRCRYARVSQTPRTFPNFGEKTGNFGSLNVFKNNDFYNTFNPNSSTFDSRPTVDNCNSKARRRGKKTMICCTLSINLSSLCIWYWRVRRCRDEHTGKSSKNSAEIVSKK